VFVNMYMPTDYNDVDGFESYIDICSKISCLFTDTASEYLLIMGDFNCDINSRFYPAFMQLATENHSVCSNISRMANVITYGSDNGHKYSRIDYILYEVNL
jgi:endonuclease/exonuclease/phosphatase family metal-dependent hydrolase